MADEQPTEEQSAVAPNPAAALPPAQKDPILRSLFYLALFGIVLESSLNQIITFLRGAVGI